MSILKIKTEEQVVAGTRLICTQFTGFDALELASRLGALLAPAIGTIAPLVREAGGAEKLLASDAETVAPALGKLLGSLGKGEAKSLARELLSSTRAVVNDKIIMLNTDENVALAFGGDLRALLGALAFSVKVNFGSFFSAGSSVPPAPEPDVVRKAE